MARRHDIGDAADERIFIGEDITIRVQIVTKNASGHRDIAEIKVRAERRCGEMEMREGGDATRARLHRVTELPPTLTELGIERTQSHR